MKRAQRIFVDDGSPEASEFENNFISYYPDDPGSCERAFAEARARLSKKTTDVLAADAHFTPRSVREIPVKSRRFRDGASRRRGASSLWNKFARAVSRVFSRFNRSAGDGSRRSRRSGFMTMGRSMHSSNRRLITP